MTLGPRTKTEYVVVRQGRPCQVLEGKPVKVMVKQLKDKGPAVEQDINGWVTMPPDHWEALKREFGIEDAEPEK